MADRKVAAEVYLVIKPYTYMAFGERKVRRLVVDRIRQSKPSLDRGEIAIRVKLTFDERAIIDAIPVVEADVPMFIPPDPELTVGAE